MYTPYWPHAVDFWRMRNESNVFYTSYEMMKHDLPGVLKKLTKFLDKPNLSEEDAGKLIEHLSFDKMKGFPFCLKKTKY